MICGRWGLDPAVVSQWPWHRTRFYEEWLQEIANEYDRAEQEEWLRELFPDRNATTVGVEGLPGMGATFREVK